MVTVVGLALASSAGASRAPTAPEGQAIKAALMAACEGAQPGCVWDGHARVSTVDDRYARAAAHGDAYDHSALLKRTGGRWAVQMIQGGGVRDCREWWEHAPTRVVHDLGLSGLTIDSQRTRRCPARKLKLRRCGTIDAASEGVAVKQRITSRGIRCRKARRIVRVSNNSGRTPPGWSCLGSGEGATCARTTMPEGMLSTRRWALPYTRHVRSRTL